MSNQVLHGAPEPPPFITAPQGRLSPGAPRSPPAPERRGASGAGARRARCPSGGAREQRCAARLWGGGAAPGACGSAGFLASLFNGLSCVKEEKVSVI